MGVRLGPLHAALDACRTVLWWSLWALSPSNKEHGSGHYVVILADA